MAVERIRPFVAADEGAVIAFIAALQEDERALHPSRAPGCPAMAAAYLAGLHERVRGARGALLIAERDGVAVGFVCGWLASEDDPLLTEAARRYGYIADLYVAPRARRQGLARRLLAAIEGALAEAGAERVLIGVLAANLPARRAYEGAGYRAYEVVHEKALTQP